MPRIIEICGVPYSVATEEELLEFANRIRKAGNANLLDALLPSQPNHATKCLIARALNFECGVAPMGGHRYESGADVWGMRPVFLDGAPEDPDERRKGFEEQNAQIEALAMAADLPIIKATHTFFEPHYRKVSRSHSVVLSYLKLPEEIGNAAKAFDLGLAFQDYDLTRLDNLTLSV